VRSTARQAPSSTPAPAAEARPVRVLHQGSALQGSALQSAVQISSAHGRGGTSHKSRDEEKAKMSDALEKRAALISYWVTQVLPGAQFQGSALQGSAQNLPNAFLHSCPLQGSELQGSARQTSALRSLLHD
jgi:hypothetical protein